MLQKVMIQQLLRRRATLDIHAQTHRQERLELFTQTLGLLEARRAVGGDQIQGLEGLLVEVGRFRLNHFDGHDAERPDVDFRAVLLLLDDLGGHPVGGADHGGALGLGLGELGAEAEIGWRWVSKVIYHRRLAEKRTDLDVAAGIQKDVVALDVAVDNVLRVQVLKTLACLSRESA